MAGTACSSTTGGFTLIELLISLALIGIMVVLLYGGLRLGSRTWEGVEIKSGRSEGLRLARGFLQRTLLQAHNVHWRLDNVLVSLFTGDQEQLEVVAPLNGFVGLGGLYLLRFTRIDQGQRHNLVVQRWLVHRDILSGDLAGIPPWQPLERPANLEVPYDAPQGLYGTSLLLPSAGRLTFSYFGPLPDGTGSDWQEDWQGRLDLPQLVKISLGGDEGWPDLVVALADSAVQSSSQVGGASL
jgi:general secretion pathway protein J